MFPLLPFVAGLAAGIFGIRLLKDVKGADYQSVNAAARERMARTGDGLRQAAVAGLSAIEQSSAGLRSRLTPDPAAEIEAVPANGTTRKRSSRKAASAPAEKP